MTQIITEKVKIFPGNGLRTGNQFKKFLLDFAGFIEEVSKFKMSFYDELEVV